MTAKLKVFTWSDGFHAYTVATTSRANALAAWGVGRDLFKDGDATQLDKGDDYDAALASPGETIKRGLSVDVGKVSSLPKPKAPNKADAEKVARLEADLERLKAEQIEATAMLGDRRKALDEEAARLDDDYQSRSAALVKSLEAAKRKVRG